MVKPHIFGVGTGKTGTNSLAVALQQMGLSCYHAGHESYYENDEIKNKLLENKKEKKPPTEGIEGYDALIDYPVFTMFKELDKTVSNAKFIMTYRPPDDCALSWCRMITDQHERNISRKWRRGFKDYSEFVRSHNDSVLKYFYARPEKLLILDVREEDRTKWALLTKFLGKNCPKGVPYPQKFRYTSWQLEE